MIERADARLVKDLDQDQYYEKDLTEIKVALHMPYLNYQAAYERVDGEMLINNIHYNYVKKKISNDTLYLLCLPNATKTRLQKEKTHYAGTVNDLPAKKQGSTAKKQAFSFECHQTPCTPLLESMTTTFSIIYTALSEVATDGFRVTQYRPPTILINT